MRLLDLLPSCLNPFKKQDLSEVEKLKSDIQANDRMIEATQPFVEEAKKRTDDGFYRLRARSGVVARRVAYEGSLMRDLTEGWGKTNG